MSNSSDQTPTDTPKSDKPVPADNAAPRSNENRSTTPEGQHFRERICSDWADREETLPEPREASAYALKRRTHVSASDPGTRLVIPAGNLKQRSNDCDYPFRAHSAFSHLTGWGCESEPGSVLVFEPAPDGHRVTLYFRERATRDTDEFYANAQIGEFWIGPRPSLQQVAADLGIETRHLRELDTAEWGVNTAIIREADDALTALVDEARSKANVTAEDARVADAQLAQVVSELRLVKDEFEIAEMRKAVDATARGFDDIVRNLRSATELERGERLVEGVFHTRARIEGNEVGYDTIAAAGSHACFLHWTNNNGAVKPGDLILIDAGVEVDSLYTADITRTLPVSGTFSPVQRKVYDAVLEAADEAFKIVRPGLTFREVHAKAMEVIAHYAAEWGLMDVSAEESLKLENQFHRRYMVHGTSHHLGMDVHDCAQARRDLYLDGVLKEGMIFTIEPGFYLHPDDLTVPEEMRGIGVRIEDDILVTTDGAESLSASIPRTADEVEAWIQRLSQER